MSHKESVGFSIVFYSCLPGRELVSAQRRSLSNWELGMNSSRVADIKTIGLGAVSYYKPGAEGTRAVERRSRKIQAEYEVGGFLF